MWQMTWKSSDAQIKHLYQSTSRPISGDIFRICYVITNNWLSRKFRQTSLLRIALSVNIWSVLETEQLSNSCLNSTLPEEERGKSLFAVNGECPLAPWRCLITSVGGHQ